MFAKHRFSYGSRVYNVGDEVGKDVAKAVPKSLLTAKGKKGVKKASKGRRNKAVKSKGTSKK